MNVVICEDNRKEQFELRRYLESGNIHVLESFSNGRELLNWLEKNPGKADLVITDIVLPVLDGFAAFCEMIKNKMKEKVVFVTIENSKDVIRSLIDMGAVQYITKPLDRDLLLEKLRPFMH